VDGGRVVIEFGPVDFIQINREINASMVTAALELLLPTAGDTVLDLFCGLGNFTLPLALRARRAVGVEGDAALVAKAGRNAARNGVGNAAFFRRIYSNRRCSDRGRTSTMIWCCSIRRERALPLCCREWRIGVRAESCIFPAIRGVWRGMPRSWCTPKGSS